MTDHTKTLSRAIDCLEILNKRPRPMCRDCADEDGICPNGGLDCDMRALIAGARSALAASAGRLLNEEQVKTVSNALRRARYWVGGDERAQVIQCAIEAFHSDDPTPAPIPAVGMGEQKPVGVLVRAMLGKDADYPLRAKLVSGSYEAGHIAKQWREQFKELAHCPLTIFVQPAFVTPQSPANETARIKHLTHERDMALAANRGGEKLRVALEGAVRIMERMDTLRHIDGNFPELDAARAALAAGQEKAS